MLTQASSLQKHLALAVLLGLSGCAAAPQSEPEETAVATEAAVTASSKLLSIVAHEDDDLLFINPTIDNAIKAGAYVETVYVTAGDAGEASSYWLSRESGIRAAYAQMAGVSNAWTFDTPSFAGKTVYRYKLNGTRVTAVFLRLPDGNVDGSGFATTSDDPYRTNYTSLYKLWAGTISSIPVVGTWSTPNGTSYTSSDLKNVLGALMSDFTPTHVSTLDSVGESASGYYFFHGGEHSDHLHSAKYAFNAHLGYTGSHRFTMYRDYNIENEAVNLSTSENTEKWNVFATYAAYDDLCNASSTCSNNCTQSCTDLAAYAGWTWRQYPINEVTGTSGWIAGLQDKCLDVRGGNYANGTPVQIWDCTDVGNQKWSIHDGKIRVVGTNKCLDIKGGSTADGTPVQIWDCLNVANQKWTVFDDGLIRGAGGKCLEVSNGNSANGTPVQISSCTSELVSGSTTQYAVKSKQDWTIRYGVVDGWTSGTQFSDSDASGNFGLYSYYYDTFRLADVDGDGDDDACARLPDGIYCALNQGGSFGTYTRFTTEFSDALLWGAEKYGMTIQFGDINGDGKADVCGRGIEGIRCATSTGTAFGGSAWWTTSFSDSTEFDSAAYYYGSIRLADVNGDGYHDVCGRGSAGIVCAINTKAGSFASATTWLGTDFTDALDWNAEKYGMTIQLGDINGDGKADVCGRGTEMIICAVANAAGTGFENPRRWSFRSDFADTGTTTGWDAARSYYFSIRLADVNGDGYADVCGRSSTGVVCGLSNGLSFGTIRRVLPQDYTDAYGWQSDKYGSTIQFGDLDGNGRLDICGRGSARLLCAKSP